MKTEFKEQDEAVLFLKMKNELIKIILELQTKQCTGIDSLIWEVCYTRDKNYQDTLYFEDLGVEAQYSTKPGKNSRFNMSYNCKIYKSKDADEKDVYDLRFRLASTGTLSELQ